MSVLIRQTCAAILAAWLLSGFNPHAVAAESPPPDFDRQVAPLLKKYCAGCHNADDRDGRLVLESYQSIQEGGKHGAVVIPGDSNSSRMIRLLTGQAKPQMPPKDEPRPTADDIALLRAWIDAGAKGPLGATPVATELLVPKIPPAVEGKRRPITALDWSPDGTRIAVARYGEVELLSTDGHTVIRKLSGHPGKITSVHFTADGAKLLVASGVTGVSGEARLWNLADGKVASTLTAHRDLLFAAVSSLDRNWIATAGYDREINVWDMTTAGPLKKTLTGHNDAIYDLAISLDGNVLASASGDSTVKLWNMATGERLDTLSQPLKEQYAVAFSPDGNSIVAAGVDHRIRVWKFVSRQKPASNPLVLVRFAQDSPIVRLAFARDGRLLATASEDRTLKLWSTDGYHQVHDYARQSDVVAAVAFAPNGRQLAVGRLDGSLEILSVPARATSPQMAKSTSHIETSPEDGNTARTSNIPAVAEEKLATTTEAEPNDTPATATRLSVPGTAEGKIHAVGAGQKTDVDLYRFDAKKGESWIVEIKAARDKSPLDSKVQVLDATGKPIVRMLLRAVRDSYFLFHSRNSRTAGDFRLFSGNEMKLNDLIYANGEVFRLFSYSQGPDSGYRIYPGRDKRTPYFDTTATTHALGEPCYVIEPHPPGADLPPNGLPVFPIYFENDDQSGRKLGRDSQLTFTAPADGSYLVRVEDTRGSQGPKFHYQLTVRRPKPDFQVKLLENSATVSPGTGQMFELSVDRVDGFEGDVRVDVTGLPPGFTATTPVVIQAGQLVAAGTIMAAADAPAPTKENSNTSRLTATATIDGRKVTHDLGSLGQFKLGAAPKLLAWLERIEPGSDIEHAKGKSATDSKRPLSPAPVELFIEPGQTISTRLRVKRLGDPGAISFGKDDVGENLPHGVYVDDIGLNGVLLEGAADERTIFITADTWVPEQTRPFFLRAQQFDKPTTPPVILHVRRRTAESAAR